MVAVAGEARRTVGIRGRWVEMPFLRSYDHDVFVSYSLANDAYELDQKPWVTRFVDRLTTELRNRLPNNGKDVKFYFAGKGDIRPGQQLDSCFDAAKKAALFLIIGSPRYADVWPAGELRNFTKKHGATDRVFVAEMLPCSYPDIIGNPMRSTFHSQVGNAAQPFEDSRGSFSAELAKLGEAMAKKLEAMAASSAASAQNPVNPDLATVLIAQPVTDEGLELAARLQSHLRQFEVAVVPEEGFVEEGAAFKQEFEEALGHAQIVVQLLGRHAGRKTKDFPDGYDAYQAEAARGKPKVRLMQWLDLSVDVASITDSDHQALLAGADAMLFEEFKDMVLRAATAPPPPPPVESASGGHGFIFVDAAQVDEATARKVFDACRERHLPVLMPLYGSDGSKEWRENYAEANRIAVIHEKSDSEWLTTQLRLFLKTLAKRRGQQECLAFLGPPPPKSKDQVPVYHPKIHFIDGTKDGLDELYARLFQ